MVIKGNHRTLWAKYNLALDMGLETYFAGDVLIVRFPE
jgi:hypothetical protein